MKKLWFVLICLIVPLQQGATGQSGMPRLVFHHCGQWYGEGGWETLCSIQLLDGDSNSQILSGQSPRWSPDGSRIAFIDGPYGGNLAVLTLAEGTVSTLTSDYAESPRWSPDGTRIAFVSYRTNFAELYIVGANGSAETRLTNDVGFTGEFAWSPGGAAIAFVRTVDGAPELHVMQADGSSPLRLTYGVGVRSGSFPSWSADGARIAFNCATEICSVNTDGTNVARLTPDVMGASDAAFSPVDGRVAFATTTYGGSEVVVMAVDGTIVRVAPGVQGGQPTWTPDGGALAFVRPTSGGCFVADGSCYPGPTGEIYVVHADGTGLRQIGSGIDPHWSPSVAGAPVATFTSDCTAVACQFDASGSSDPDGTIASYVWWFGDGTTGSGVAPSHTYVNGGHFSVRLFVTDDGGTTTVTDRQVTANTPPVASFSVVCTGGTCTFDGSSSSDSDGTITSYRWAFGDGSDGTEPVVIHSYATGTYTATLTVTDQASLDTHTQTLSIVNAVPAASFTVQCAALTCTYDASASSDDDGSIVRYNWQFGDGSTLNGYAAGVTTHTLAAAGTYTAVLTVYDVVQQSATASHTFTVTAPQPAFMHIGDLDGSRSVLQKTWNAFVTIQLHDGSHGSVGGVVVSGSWNDGTAASCTTDNAGRCLVSRYGLPKKATAVTFRVVGATHGTLQYKPAGNHDPDGDSSGTLITIPR